MEPIFFPFTYVSDAALTALTHCFKRIVIYQPSRLSVPAAFQDLEGKGGLTIRIPVESDEKTLATVLQQYRAWAELHQGDGLTYFTCPSDAYPFLGDSSLSRIRDEIRHRNDNGASGAVSDPIRETSVFLQVAQELDRQNAELELELRQVSRREQALFEDLKGDGEETVPGLQAAGLSPAIVSPAIEDPGAYMTSERVAAWSRLMLNDPVHSGIFVTTSPAIFDFIKEDAPNLERVLSVELSDVVSSGSEGKKLFQDSLMDKLAFFLNSAPGKALPDADAVSDSESGTVLSVHLAPGTTPDQFFSRFVARDQADKKRDRSAGRYPNTLVCLLDTSPSQ